MKMLLQGCSDPGDSLILPAVAFHCIAGRTHPWILQILSRQGNAFFLLKSDATKRASANTITDCSPAGRAGESLQSVAYGSHQKILSSDERLRRYWDTTGQNAGNV